MIHSLIGRHSPQYPHVVVKYDFAQCGQLAIVSNVSNSRSHFSHFHLAPNGGAIRQLGQANSTLRGIFS
jgi:hypothetical protein